MNYQSYDQEWDDTWNEMKDVVPKLGDKVLCATLKVEAGEIVGARNLMAQRSEWFFVVRLNDGSVDEFSAEDVLVRKTTQEVAA